ncbi:MAG: beta-xylosidase, partial [Bacteroidia bacterium]|nr:beta-xylosidase [Bacteroidia bacterium]
AAAYARTYELARQYDVNILGAVSWAFEFEDQEWFAGFRDMATNGVDKPVLNTLRMFGQMRGDFLPVSASRKLPVEDIMVNSVRADEDVNALASASESSISVMVWNYHDDDEAAEPTDIEILVNNVAQERVYVQHYRIDETHSNSYNVWKSMGSPQNPTQEQYEELERSGKLELLTPGYWTKVDGGSLKFDFPLSRQGISLIKLTW